MFRTLFLLITVLNAQKNLDESTKPIPVSQAGIQFQWTYDTCAGSLNTNGQLVKNPVKLGLDCVDEKGKPTGRPEAKNIFPAGFSSVRLVKGLSGGETVDLLPEIQNSPILVGEYQNFTIRNLNRFKSDYYALSLIANDVNGNLVKGQSPIFIIQNTDPVPPSIPMLLHSPLPGSFWIANVDYRVRFEGLAGVSLPSRYHMDLLTPAGDLVQRVLEAVPPLAGDNLLGTNRNVLYLIWKVPKELANRKYKLRISGVNSNGSTTSPLAAPIVAESGMFFIGPAKPGN